MLPKQIPSDHRVENLLDLLHVVYFVDKTNSNH